MKANEFFKKHGYRKSKSACAENDWLNTGFWVRLKRLVESHELVDAYGGLDKAKTRCYPAKLLTMQTYHALKQAIADVESCQ